MNSKSIAVVFRDLKPMTGTFTIVKNVFPLLRKKGWEIHLVCHKTDTEYFKKMGVHVHNVPFINIGKSARRWLFDKLCRLKISKIKPQIVWGHGDILKQDILSLHNCVHKTFELTRPNEKLKEQGMYGFHRKLLERQNFKLLLANSNLMRKEVEARFDVPSSKIKVVYPGIDIDRISQNYTIIEKNKAQKELGLQSDKIYLGFVTSGDFKKRGLDRLIDILQSLSLEVKKQVGAFVVGKDKETLFYLEKGKKCQLEGDFFIFQPRESPQIFYDALDLFVYPAYFEEFGLAPLEAAANGLPVITTCFVGASELLRDHSQSVLFPEYDLLSFKQEIEKKIESKAFSRTTRAQFLPDGQGYAKEVLELCESFIR
ncbi:MAG: glycosyltransferase family 4 protein [Elusimicrobiota bacterium]